MTGTYYTADQIWELPPLILHPFSDATSPHKLMQSSRASLMLQGLLPKEAYSDEELHNTLLDGRYCEIRMLYYVGKDLVRWIDQCVGTVEREPDLQRAGLEWQSFSALVVDDVPSHVCEKLKNWGVADYRSIFSRAIGLNSVFASVPERHLLSAEFIRNYHQYADHMYRCRQEECQYIRLRPAEFRFELYASGEYSRMLEQQWQEG